VAITRKPRLPIGGEDLGMSAVLVQPHMPVHDQRRGSFERAMEILWQFRVRDS
jgi:hypothetical protein